MGRSLTAGLRCSASAGRRLAQPAGPGPARSAASAGPRSRSTLSGARLADAQEILFYQPGITVDQARRWSTTTTSRRRSRSPPTPARPARLPAPHRHGRQRAADLQRRGLAGGRRGRAEQRLRRARSRSRLNVTVNGVADNEDVDYFVVEAKKGERITAEVEGIRLGDHALRPLRRDPRREAVRAGLQRRRGPDLAGRVRLGPRPGGRHVHHPGPRERLRRATATCLYRLHVGNFPRPTATVPAGGKLGETLDRPLDRRRAGRDDHEGHAPGRARPRLRPRRARTTRGSPPIPNPFRLSAVRQRHRGRAERRPGHTPRRSTAPVGAQRRDREAGDVDHFVFAAKKGQTFDVRVFARQLRSPLDSVLYHRPRRAAGALAGNDDTGRARQLPPLHRPRRRRVRRLVVDHLRRAGPTTSTGSRSRPVAPKLAVSIANESLQRGAGADGRGGPAGEPPGDPGQRRPRPTSAAT